MATRWPTFLTINSSSNHRNRRSRGASDRQSCTTSPRSDWLEVGYQDGESAPAVHQRLALWLRLLSMKSQRFIREKSRIPRPRYASAPKSPKASMAIPLTMETINVLALSCSIYSLKVMVIGLLALAGDPQNDNSGIHLPLQAAGEV